MEAGGGMTAVMMIGLFLFMFICYGIDLAVALVGGIIIIGLIAMSILMTVNAILYSINQLKNKNIVESVVIIALILIVIFVKLPIDNFDFFGYEFTTVTRKILELGVLNLIVLIRSKTNEQEVTYEHSLEVAVITIATIIMIVFGIIQINNKNFNTIFFNSMPSKVETFWKNREIKKSAEKLNTQSELEIILEEYKNNNSLEFSIEQINKIINEKGYKNYNGIRCYALEDYDTNTWLVGMSYDNPDGKISKGYNVGKVGNYYVNKKTFEITGVARKEGE